MSNMPPQIQTPASLGHMKPDQSTLAAAKGGSVLFVGRLFVYGSRFLITIFLARTLAAGQYGLYNLGLTAVELATFFASLGLATGLVRYIPIFASRKDEAGIWGTLQIGLGYTTLLSLVTAIGLFFLADPIAIQLFEEPRLAPLLRVLSLVVPFYNLSDMIAAATRGFKNMKYTVIAQNILQPVIRFGLLFILFLTVGLSAKWALLASGVTEIITSALLLYFLNKQFSLKRSFGSGRRETKEIMQFSLPIYLSNVVIRFSGSIKTILLGVFGTVANVGIFALVNQITLLGDMFHQSIGAVSQPIIAELYSRGATEELSRFYKLMTKWSLTVNLPLFLILVLFPNSILSLFGKSFVVGVEVLQILAWTGLVDIATGICGVMIDMTGYTRLKLVNTVTALTATIGLSLWLIPTWGLTGAAVASLTGSIIINLLRVGEVFVLLRMLPYSLAFLKPMVAGFFTAGAIFFIKQYLPPETSLAYLILNISLLFGVYVGIVLLMGLSQEDRTILARLRKRLGGKYLGD